MSALSPREIAARILQSKFAYRDIVEAAFALVISDLKFNEWVAAGKYERKSAFKVSSDEDWLNLLDDLEAIHAGAEAAWLKFETAERKKGDHAGWQSLREELVDSLRGATAQLDRLGSEFGRNPSD
jgi:hypothetical protein